MFCTLHIYIYAHTCLSARGDFTRVEVRANARGVYITCASGEAAAVW